MLENLGGGRFAAALQLGQRFGKDQGVIVDHRVADWVVGSAAGSNADEPADSGLVGIRICTGLVRPELKMPPAFPIYCPIACLYL